MNAPALFERETVKNFRTPDLLGAVILGLLVLALGVGVGTQWAAARLGFNPHLPGSSRPGAALLTGAAPLPALALLAAGLTGLVFAALRRPKRRSWWGASLLLVALAGAAHVYGFERWYFPFNALLWARYYLGDPLLRPVLVEAGAVGLGYAAFTGAALWVAGGPGAWQVSENFGSASFGDASWFSSGRTSRRHLAGKWLWKLPLARTFPLLEKLPFLRRPGDARKERGLPVGWKDGRLRYDRSGLHALIIAPTGSGKTRGFAIPTLLLHAGSVLAVDIKRELYHVTARRRRELNGGRVFRLDPFGEPGGADQAAFNPLDLLDLHASGQTRRMGDDAKTLAQMCIIETGRENNPFFKRSAQQLLTGLILEVACAQPQKATRALVQARARTEGRTGLRPGDPNPYRSMIEVRRLLMRPDDELRGHLKQMSKRRPSPEPRSHPLIRGIGAQFADMNKKEFTAVVATAREQTFFLSSPNVARVMETTTVNFEALKRRRATVYLVLPDDLLPTYNRWLRLMIACAQTAITRIEGRPKEPILFMIDEFPALGRFMRMSEGISLHRHYGIQYVLIAQTSAQLEDRYETLAANFIDNTQNRIFWAANSKKAADLIADLSGKMTVAVKSSSQSRSRSGGKQGRGGYQKGVTDSIREQGRPLVTPREAMNVPASHCFVFSRGQSPVVLRRPDYLSDALFAGLYDENPTYGKRPPAKARRQRPRVSGEMAPLAARFCRLTSAVYADGQAARNRFWYLCKEEDASRAAARVTKRPALLGTLAKADGHSSKEAGDAAAAEASAAAVRELAFTGQVLFEKYRRRATSGSAFAEPGAGLPPSPVGAEGDGVPPAAGNAPSPEQERGRGE